MGGVNDDIGDDGFTLAELLVVIVVLGILATVTVFAVQGITEESAETACATELGNLETAEELHLTLAGTYADEATLLASGAIKTASSMYDVTGDDSGYSVTVASGATCTAGATGGGGGSATPPGPTPPPVVAMVNANALHSVPAWRYRDGDPGSEANQILVFGGAGGRADWVAADDADIVTSRRTHFMDINAISTAQVDTLLDAADSTGLTTVVVYAADDAGSLAAYIQAEYGNYNETNLVAAQFGGGQLAGLLAST
jgi:prepilin-type N-terminal cleavage/methylation domain-containing protein